VPLLLALTFGGQKYPWGSPVVLGLFAGSVASLIAYVVAERYASDPILPLQLFRNRIFSLGNLAGFLLMMAFMSTIAFLPLFMQLGQGLGATTSGLATLPLMFGLMASSIVAGQITSRTGSYKGLLICGAVLTFLGTWLLSQMDIHTTQLDLIWRMLVLGIGLGPSQSLFNLAIQDALPKDQMGVATSSTQFFRQIGATMGVALFGTLLTNYLNADLGKIMPGIDLAGVQSMGAMANTGSALPDFVKQAISGSITHVFQAGLYVVAVAIAVILLMPPVKLSSGERTEDEGAIPAHI
jgi:MFS family permease